MGLTVAERKLCILNYRWIDITDYFSMLTGTLKIMRKFLTQI